MPATVNLNRKDFLRLLAAAAAAPGWRAAQAAQAGRTPTKTEQFLQRVMTDVSTAWLGANSYIGDRLGLFQAMAAAGPVTAAELAGKTRLNARLLREWLNAMAFGGYIEYQPAGKKYYLPPEHAAVLADEESPVFAGGSLEMVAPMVAAANQVVESLRTGKPIAIDSRPPELFEAMERTSAPAFKHRLAPEWIAAMPEVEKKLRDGGMAVDVGCGRGMASMVLARAFPKSRFFGYDPHKPSIQRARANARTAGLAGRVEFVASDSSRLPPGRFDLVTVFNSVHHFDDPVGLLGACRKSLAPGGACFFNEPALSEKVEENLGAGPMNAYAATTLWCLHDSMANHGAGIGADTSEPLMRELAGKAGFRQFRKLGISNRREAFYELKA